MIVVKLGGTSVGSGERFVAAAERVAERRGRGCLAVVSAMARVTRELEGIGGLAVGGRLDDAREAIAALRARHVEAIGEAVAAPAEAEWATAALDAELARVDRLATAAAAAGRLAPPRRDRILAAGELVSSRILAAALESRGVDAAWIDPRDLVATDDHFGFARPDEAEIERRVAARARPELAAGRAVVTGGFVGRAPGGETTILGWEASDYSATLLGAALPAELVEIFSDVDGVFTADPRLVPDARLVPRLSYAEATDLAWLGAKVLHPSTMAPVARRGVPVRIRNSFRPEREGTLVGPDVADAPGPRGVAVKGGLTAQELIATAGATCGARLLDQLAGGAAGTAAESPKDFAPPPIEELERLGGEGGGEGLALVSVVGAAWGGDVDAAALAALGAFPFLPVPRNGCAEHRSWAVPDAVRAEAVARLERALFSEPEG